MKKFLAMAIAVAAVLTGCVKNETFAPANEIQFKNFALSNKALVADGTFDTKLTFGVEMYKAADKSLWDKGEVVYKTSYWGFDDAKFWPTEAGSPVALNFFAYYPYGAAVACDTDKGITINNANIGKTDGTQVDYMIAKMAGPLSLQSAAVPVAFEHISSLLQFKAQDISVLNDLQGKVTIKGITVKQVSTSGKYVNTAANAVAGTWTADTAVDMDAIALTTLVKTTVVELPSVMVVPNTLTGNEIVEVVFDVAEYTYGDVVVPAQTGVTITKELKTATIDTWAQGKKYVYTLKFNLTKDQLEIKFAPTVTEWTDGGSDDLVHDFE